MATEHRAVHVNEETCICDDCTRAGAGLSGPYYCERCEEEEVDEPGELCRGCDDIEYSEDAPDAPIPCACPEGFHTPGGCEGDE